MMLANSQRPRRSLSQMAGFQGGAGAPAPAGFEAAPDEAPIGGPTFGASSGAANDPRRRSSQGIGAPASGYMGGQRTDVGTRPVTGPMGTLPGGGQTGGPTPGRRSDGLDQAAIDADPQGFARWQQEKARFEAGQKQSGGPTPGTFSTGNNLINAQITPDGGSPLTQQATGMVGGLMNSYGGANPTPQASQAQQQLAQLASGSAQTYMQTPNGVGGITTPGYQQVAPSSFGQSRQLLSQLAGGSGAGGSGSFALSGDTAALRGVSRAQLDKVLNTTPDRASLARDAFQLMQEERAPQVEQQFRRLGQRAAALGRVGSGMTTNELTDLETVRQRDADRLQRGMANDAAQLTLQDAMSKFDAARGLTSDFAGQDISAGGLNLGYENAAAGRAQFDAQLRRGVASDLAGLDQQARADAVGERDTAYRTGLDQRDFAVLQDRERFNRNRTQALDASSLTDAAQNRDLNVFDRDMLHRRNQFTDISDFLNNRENRDALNRNELRTERNYQYGLDQDAIDRATQERMMEESLLNGRFRRGMDLAGFGYQGDPYGAMRDFGRDQTGRSQFYGQQADDAFGAFGDIASQWAFNRSRRRQDPRRSGAPTRRPDPLDDLVQS